MRYLGGKSRIAKALTQVILANTEHRERLIEPFCGGGAMTAALAPHFRQVCATDIHEDLILMWQELQKGWRPPDFVSEEEYIALKKDPPSALRGFVGFGCSFGGKWFGGYARGGNENYTATSKRSVLRQLFAHGTNTNFNRGEYHKAVVGFGDVVYCDPPYAKTTGYETGGFNSNQFYDQCEWWAFLGADVFVSEYSAPGHWSLLWEKPYTQSLRGDLKTAKQVTEKLFKVRIK